eukprot:g7788.t1
MLYQFVIGSSLSLVSLSTALTACFTYYSSYPECCDNPSVDPTECEDFSGCKYKGQFALFDDTKSLSWVQSNSIIAFYDNADPSGSQWRTRYGGKTVRLSKSWAGKTYAWESTIVDTCGNGDCNNCCADNANPATGYLVDIEYWSALKVFGTTDAVQGNIEFTILDGPAIPSKSPSPSKSKAPGASRSKSPTPSKSKALGATPSKSISPSKSKSPGASPSKSPSSGTADPTQRCGTSWSAANSQCGRACPNNDDRECPSGQYCWSDLSTTPCGSAGGVARPTQRCGFTWSLANGLCGTPCPNNSDDECPGTQRCWSDLSTNPC